MGLIMPCLPCLRTCLSPAILLRLLHLPFKLPHVRAQIQLTAKLDMCVQFVSAVPAKQ